ncbi:hypothetical protein HYX06_06510 [Candidatus Woesearchaeota archaeon]|nr:hypothetical protein [Candidatus Woesearchaeota archaeon]
MTGALNIEAVLEEAGASEQTAKDLGTRVECFGDWVGYTTASINWLGIGFADGLVGYTRKIQEHRELPMNTPDPYSQKLLELFRMQFQTCDRFYEIGNNLGLYAHKERLDGLTKIEIFKATIKRICEPVSNGDYAELLVREFEQGVWERHVTQISRSKH